MPCGPDPETSTAATLWSEPSEDAMTPFSAFMPSAPTCTEVSTIPSGTVFSFGSSLGVM